MDTSRDPLDLILDRTERGLLRALEMSTLLLVGMDAGARLRLVNAATLRITGFEREALIGRTFADALLPEGLRKDHGAIVNEAAAGEREGEEVLESSVQTADGGTRDVRWQLVCAHPEDRDDEEVVLFAIGEDTTESRARQAWARRTEKLMETGRMVAGLAHELRNPLNGAHLHATLLERLLLRSEAKDDEMLAAVQVVQGEIRRLSGLVSDFLDFARPVPLLLERVSLRALCGQALAAVAFDAAASGVQVKAELPDAGVEVVVDAARIDLALQNLLRNGIEAVAPVGTGEVVLRAAVRGEEAILEVVDDGQGPPGNDTRIYEPFYSTKGSGTGLGLAIVHRIAADHDGHVEHERRAGKTVFRMTLPVASGHQIKPSPGTGDRGPRGS